MNNHPDRQPDIPTLTLPNGLDYDDVLADLMEQPVHVTELLTGQHWAATIFRSQTDRDPEIKVASEDGYYLPFDTEWGHAFYRALFDERLDWFLAEMLRLSPPDILAITIRGEYLPEWAYGNAQPEIRLFGVELDGQPIPPEPTFALFAAWAVKHVPVLSAPNQTLYHWLNRRSAVTAALGKSRLACRPRAGVVIRPLTESTHPSIGRTLLKLEAAYAEQEQEQEEGSHDH